MSGTKTQVIFGRSTIGKLNEDDEIAAAAGPFATGKDHQEKARVVTEVGANERFGFRIERQHTESSPVRKYVDSQP